MQEYGLDLYFLQVWNDIRLAQGQDRNFSFTGNDIKNIWTPDTYFMNAKKTEIKDVSYLACFLLVSVYLYAIISCYGSVTLSCFTESK